MFKKVLTMPIIFLLIFASFLLATSSPAHASTTPTQVLNLKTLVNNPAPNNITLVWAPPAEGPVGLTAYKVTVSPPVNVASTPTNLGIKSTLNVDGKLVSFTTMLWTNNVTFPGLAAGAYDFTVAAQNTV